MKNLANLKTAELVAEFNAHSGKPAIAKWKKKVSDLVAALLKMRPDLYVYQPTEASDRMDGFEAPADEIKAQTGRPVDHGEAHTVVKPKATTASKKSAKAKKAASEIERGAIRERCEQLLLKAKGTDETTRRPLGLPYSEILERVRSEFPQANTSINCLRWYATKLNKQTGKDRVVMPLRPKAKSEAA